MSTDNQPETGQQPSADQPAIIRQPKLTNKQKLFIQHLLDNPKATASQAYMAAYDTKHKTATPTIHSEAHKTMSKPSVKQALDNNVGLFESVVVGTARDWGNSENSRRRELALQASYYGHDKVKGKATQHTESVSTTVTLSLNLAAVAGDRLAITPDDEGSATSGQIKIKK